MNCWICGNPADTGEHMIKVSDIRDLFGHITTKKPLFRRVDRNPQEIVQGVKSQKLKFKTGLCAYCNNTRTQPHDMSWEALATFLRRRSPPIRPGEVVRPCPKSFQNGLRGGLLGVHLYFLKLFGCLILDGKVPIDTQPLARAIFNNAPHPHVYLTFLAVTSRKLQQCAIVTPVETISINGTLGAQWFYFVGRIGVHMIYAPVIHKRSYKVHLWHPSHTTKTLTLDGM